MPEKRKALIIINPKAGKTAYSRSLNYVEKELARAGIESQRFFTRIDGKGLLSSHLAEVKYTELLVLGGDGTLNYTVNEMYGNERNGNGMIGNEVRGNEVFVDPLPISIISTGTGNDSVRSIHGVTRFKEQVEIAINGRVRAYDLGQCNGRYFLNGLGLGFDGQVVLEMDRKRKKRKSRLDYLRTVLGILYRFKEKEINFSIDGKAFKRKVLLLMVSNGTTFGGGFVINPGARADDGLLDVCVLGEISSLERFWHLPKLIRGRHGILKAVEFYTARKVSIGPSRELVAHLDGEYFGHPPFEVSVQPGALLVRGAKS